MIDDYNADKLEFRAIRLRGRSIAAGNAAASLDC